MEENPKEETLNSALSSPHLDESPGPSGLKDEQQPNMRTSSLRERLKRTRRAFNPPRTVSKRPCVEDEDRGFPCGSQKASTHSEEANTSELKSKVDDVPTEEDLIKLRKEFKEKTETLRRLKLVKLYREKNNLTELRALIDKWRSCAQAALYELQAAFPIKGRKANMSELIDTLGFDENILHFDRSNDDFMT